jgi:diacylglycerol kinase family enzyme
MRRRFLFIVNPGAGIGGSPFVARVTDALAQRGASVTCIHPRDIEAGRQGAREAAASGSYDAIVAAGGDGTIRQIAGAMLGSAVALGIVPVGTGNVLAHEIGLAPTVGAVVDMLLEGPSTAVMCATANGEPFLLMAGAGFDGRVIAALDQRFKSHVGKVAYAGPVLGALVRPVDELKVVVDGARYEANWAVIANARHYAGRFVLARKGIHERGLHAVLFKAKNRAALVGQLASLILGRLDARAAAHADVEIVPCARASIAAHQPVPTQIDGDSFGTTPLEVESGSAELQLIVPAHRPVADR